jgi:beta-N-acetylhexosaminidase
MFKNFGKLLLIRPGSLSEEEREFYRDLGIENFIFFKEHFEGDFHSYLNQLESLKKLSLLAVDQEGGRVCRIKGDFESPLEIAKRAEKEGFQVFKVWAEKIAETLRSYRLNLNLSPVVDRGQEDTPEFLKGRTYGSDPERIIHLASLFIEEHKQRGLKTCLKHFPGLFEVTLDPHKELPIKKKIYREDLLPFVELAPKTGFIMTTHLLALELDHTYPVTFSERAIHFLRKEFEFRGVILTDDLSMGALKSFHLSERIVLSLVSGHNLLIYCGPFEELREALFESKSEIEKSQILQEKIRESLTILARY